MTSLLRCAAALVAVFSFSLPVQIQSSIPGFSGPRDTRRAPRFQTPVVAGGSAANALTPAERAAGWTLLFDGRSLAGWQPSGQAVWSVEDGMIISRGKAPGILRTITTYQNFELKADFWADDTMNSAIFVRCPSELKRSRRVTLLPNDDRGRRCQRHALSAVDSGQHLVARRSCGQTFKFGQEEIGERLP